MKNASKLNLKLSAISLGVIALFSAGSVLADDEELKALTQPKSSVQVEMIGVDQNSAKFGEYNGLYGHPSGAYPNGALDVRGGSAYKNNEQGDTNRWSVTGDNLGLTSRSANASVADQGSWSFGVNFDQLQHNTSDTYQTPYNGSMGGSQWTLPSQLTGAQAMNANPTVQTSLKTMPISNTRNNTTVNGSAAIDANSNITFEYNNLTQTGAKLGAFASAGGGSGYREIISILPMPVSSQTDTVNLAYNWKGEASHFTASYFGSFFQNGNSAVSIQPMYTAAGGSNTAQTLSLAPNNAFNQLNMAGGYDFTKKTKLTANVSAGQNTQNQGYGGTYDPSLSLLTPQSSMNGLVNTLHADMKVTDQNVKDLVLTAGAKFDQRENLSQSTIYGMKGIDTAESVYLPNTPMSIKQLNLLLSGDYKIDKSQKINLAFTNDAINRWCNQYGGNGNYTITNYGTATNVNTAATTSAFNSSSSCVSATSSNENRVNATYKLKATEDVNVKVTAGYANRKTAWDQSAIVGMPYSTSATYAQAQPMGYNSGNQIGYMPFFEASRKQFIAKASSDWQVTDAWMLGFGGKYTNDIYPDSTYGVQNGNSWSLNLDSAYNYAENGTFTAYATQQNQSRSLTNLYGYYNGTSTATRFAGAPYAWNNTLQNYTTTLGLNVKQGGLADGKLTLIGDLMTSLARSQYTTSVPYQTTSGAAGACTAPTSGATCGIAPGIQNNLAAFKLSGIYQIDKNQKVGLAYWYQHLYSNDYYYNGYAYGSTNASVLPTNQTNPSYSVNVISANYTYTFD